MKKYLLITLAAFSLLCACNKTPAEGGSENEDVTPVVKLEVTNIENNCATISATLEAGKFYGGKIINAVKVSNVDIDYTSEIKLIQYLRENAEDIAGMPYTKTVEKLTFEKDYFTAVIIYDKDGRVCSSQYKTWTAQGMPDGISNENSAGDLDNNDIN